MATRSRRLPGANRRERQPSALHKRLYNAAWNRASREYRESNPLCRNCQLLHRPTATYCTDHVIPHDGDYDLFWDVSNWQPLCKKCHDWKTWRESNGMVIDWQPRANRFVVVGQPGTGKTTWWEHEVGGHSFRIWDMDLTAKALGLSARYPRPPHELELLKGHRDAFERKMVITDHWVYVCVSVRRGYRIAKETRATLVHCTEEYA